MTKRRDFLKTSAYVAAGAMVLPLGSLAKSMKEAGSLIKSAVPKPGVQVYSVRDALKQDFAGSIQKLADIGYKYVEGYGMGANGKIYGMAPAEYKKIIDGTGMKMTSCHCNYFTKDQANKVADIAKEAGLEYVVIPYLGDNLRNDYAAMADNFNALGEIMKANGLKFGYHNHAFEFEKQGDDIPLEILLENTQPDLVTFEADLYWVVKGGHDPMTLFKKFPGRFSMFHVKDANKELEQTTVGTGIIDFVTILKNRELPGLKYYFIEDERTDDPFANLQANYDYMVNTDFS